MKTLNKSQYTELMEKGDEDEYQTSRINICGEIVQCDIFIKDGKATGAVTAWEEGEEDFFISGTFYDDANQAIEIFRTNFRLQTQNWSF